MDPYYDHHRIPHQPYYAYAVPVSALPGQWVVYDQVNIPAHYNIPIFYPQPVHYVDDVAILNTPNPMWVNQEQHPVHLYDSLVRQFEDFIEERMIMEELEPDPAFPERINTGTSGSVLSEEEISEHLHVYPAQGKMSEVDTCSICLGDYENKEKMGRLDCGHRFHAECIKRWLLSKNVCPLCRSTALSV